MFGQLFGLEYQNCGFYFLFVKINVNFSFVFSRHSLADILQKLKTIPFAMWKAQYNLSYKLYQAFYISEVYFSNLVIYLLHIFIVFHILLNYKNIYKEMKRKITTSFLQKGKVCFLTLFLYVIPSELKTSLIFGFENQNRI